MTTTERCRWTEGDGEPCGADATLFAFVAGALTPYFDSPVRRSFEKAANLVAYRDRMMTEFYPDLAPK